MTTTPTPTETNPIIVGGDPQQVVDPTVGSPPEPEPGTETATPTGTPSPTPDPTTDQNKQIPDAVQRRINELTAKRYEAERIAASDRTARQLAETRNAELIAQLAKAGTPSPLPTAAEPALSQEALDKLIDDRATEKMRINSFNTACDNVAKDGQKEFTDWDDALKNLNLVGALGPTSNLDFLNTAIELKNPHKVLHHLGKNLDEAERITKLPATKMAVELARIEASMNAPAPTPPPLVPLSNAPAPVIPLGGAAKPGQKDISDPNLPMEEYIALRNAQKEEHNKRYQRYQK